MEGAGVPVVAAVPGGGLAWALVVPLIFLNGPGLLVDENLLFFNHLNIISLISVISNIISISITQTFFLQLWTLISHYNEQ